MSQAHASATEFAYDVYLSYAPALGGIYSALGEKQKALDFYNQALPIVRVVGDKAGEATTLNNLGGVYYALDDMEKALANLRNAANILHEIGAAWSEVTVRSNIAFVQRKLGNLDAAAASLETAIALATKLNHPDLPALKKLLDEINAQRKK